MSIEKKPIEKEPTPVTIVPADNSTPEQKKEQAESQTAKNTANREASYLPPQEGVNQNAPEEK